jgi:hypothetical protein
LTACTGHGLASVAFPRFTQQSNLVRHQHLGPRRETGIHTAGGVCDMIRLTSQRILAAENVA